MRAGKSITEWVKKQDRNEALDCFNYCLAAFRLAPTLKTVKPKMQRIYTIDPSTGVAFVDDIIPEKKRTRIW
jgi:phage terminase large subunit GpA-like protein